MTWQMDTPADFAGESEKIRWSCVPYVQGVGLDVACGPWKVFPHSIGIDGNRYQGSGSRGPSLVMDCQSFPLFATESLDYVYSSHFLEHVLDPLAVLREWWRLVRVGGYLILYLPHKNFYPNIGQPGANPDHKSDFLPEDVVAFMRKVGGWTLVENEERSGGHEYSFFQVYRKRADSIQADIVPQPTQKRAAFARPGNLGDAVWTSSVAAQWKKQGYHVTAYVEEAGELMLANNPNIDRIIRFDRSMFWQSDEMFAYFRAVAPAYATFANFTHTVENNLLLLPETAAYYWPDDVRRTHCAGNYVEFMHEIAGVPYELQQRFYPTAEEMKSATRASREMLGNKPGRIVVLANTGSTLPKWWPFAPGLALGLATLGVHVVVLGDLRGGTYPSHPLIHVIGTQWPIRNAIAFAILVDAVIGQETGILNALALEDVPKIVMLGHSTHENLTRDWRHVVPLRGDVPCWPCHRIHYTNAHCPSDKRTKAAVCQAAIRLETVLDALIAVAVISSDERDQLKKPAAASIPITAAPSHTYA